MKRILASVFALIVTLGVTAQAHGKKHPKQNESPVTVIALDDASKVKLLNLLRKQDAAIEKKQAAQLQIDSLDKEIQKEQDEINQTAQQMAADGKIDTTTLVLDLDRLAWITKGEPK